MNLLTKQEVETTDVNLCENYTDSQVKSLCYFNYNYFAGGVPAEISTKMDDPTKTCVAELASARPGWSARAPFTKYPFHISVLMI